MAKWKSPQQRLEDDVRALVARVTPELQPRIDEWLDAHADLSYAEASPRLAKEVLWPFARDYSDKRTDQLNIVQSFGQSALKPLLDAERRASREAERALSRRVAVVEEAYRTSNGPVGAYVRMHDGRILRCIRSEYADDGEQRGYVEAFAEPTPEEQHSAAYLEAVRAREADRQYQAYLEARGARDNAVADMFETEDAE